VFLGGYWETQLFIKKTIYISIVIIIYMKRRFFGKDFNKEDDIVDMNDIKAMFREFVMNKMEKDFELMLKNYFHNKLNNEK